MSHQVLPQLHGASGQDGPFFTCTLILFFNHENDISLRFQFYLFVLEKSENKLLLSCRFLVSNIATRPPTSHDLVKVSRGDGHTLFGIYKIIVDILVILSKPEELFGPKMYVDIATYANFNL